MGRYTYYTLRVLASDNEAEDSWGMEDAIWNYLYGLEGQDSEMYYALVSHAPSCDWHGYNEDMLLLSAKFPAVRLSLVRKEENNSWRKIYQNGKERPLGKYPGCSVDRAERNIGEGLTEECKRCLRERPVRELRNKCKQWDRTDGSLREFEYGWDA